MKIAFVTTYNAEDVSNWSGTPYFMARALQRQGHEIQFIYGLRSNPNLWQRICRRISGYTGKVYDLDRDPNILRQYAADIEQRMHPETDLLFSPSSQPLTYCTKKPTIFYTDGTFNGLLKYYDIFDNLTKGTIDLGQKVEQDAINNASLCIYSSQWAANSALEYYRASPPEKVQIVSYGANVVSNFKINDIEQLVDNKQSDVCKLLFLGVNWQRKGGPKALEVVRYLNEHGFKAELHIVGIKDLPVDNLPSYVINHGFISKSTSEGQEKINAIIENAHFLLLPTIADCTPIVYAEANGYGLPCLTTNTGGVPSVVSNGVNGQLFELDASPDTYLKYLNEIFLSYDNYKKLALSAFNEYRTRLNWDTCAQNLTEAFKKIV